MGIFKKNSCNGVFVAFLMQWEPNGDQIGPSKMKNENLRLKKLKYTCNFYIFIIFYSGLSFLSPENNHIYWSPPNFSKGKIPCNPALNFSKCERL
jgi:hypothetical protein